MHTPRAILFASTLSLLPVLTAQSTNPVPVASATSTTFQVRDLTVRVWQEAAGTMAAVSRDGGRSWRNLGAQDHQLHLQFATWDPATEELRIPAGLGAAAGNRLQVVQFATTIQPEYLQALADAGVEVLHYLPENAYLVRCDRELQAKVRALPGVRWLGDLQPACKLDLGLLALAQQAGGDAADYHVVLAKKADRAKVQEQLQALGGKVLDLCGNSIFVIARLTPPQLQQAVQLDTVSWIDQHSGTSTDMNNARIQGGANAIETAGGFTGTGVRAEITEGLDQNHPDFTGRVLVRTDTTDTHGHCTAGIVGGAGVNNAAARGMLPTATIIENSYIALGAGQHYTRIQDSVNPALGWKAMQATSSWGSALVTTYTSVSATMDDALFDFDFTRTQSQSNAGTQSSRPEAWAKNMISVGGVRHGDNSNPGDDNWTNSGSCGPQSDGAIKPEISAYYDLILCSDLQGTAGYNTAAGLAGNYYTSFGGTSGATPIVNGHVGLLQEMFTSGLWNNPLPLPATPANRWDNRPHMSTAKALLVNSASIYPFSADLSRFHVGWGFPNVNTAYTERSKTVVWDEYDTLQGGQARSYVFWVPPQRTEMRATMVYADPAALANAAIHRINSLDLQISQIGTANAWWGNNGLTTGNVSTPGGVPNDRDTCEQVVLANPASGLYLAKVQATAVTQDGHVETPQLDADYALILRGVGGGFSTPGTFTFDLQTAAPGDVRAVCTGVPATGWTEGYTFLSFNTFGRKGYGALFGIENDFITSAIFGLPATTGDVFHFTNTAGQYPFSTYAFPAGLMLSLSGLSVDGLVMLNDAAGNIVGMSNVDRLTIL